MGIGVTFSSLHFSARMLEKAQVNPLPITAYLAGNAHIASQGTFESMIFLFPKWDMLVRWRVSKLDLAVNSFHLGVMGGIQSLFVAFLQLFGRNWRRCSPHGSSPGEVV